MGERKIEICVGESDEPGSTGPAINTRPSAGDTIAVLSVVMGRSGSRKKKTINAASNRKGTAASQNPSINSDTAGIRKTTMNEIPSFAILLRRAPPGNSGVYHQVEPYGKNKVAALKVRINGQIRIYEDMPILCYRGTPSQVTRHSWTVYQLSSFPPNATAWKGPNQ